MQKFIILSFMMIATSFGFKWESEEIEGNKYVPLLQMSEFYKLPIAASEGPKISLKNKGISIEFEIESRLAVFNKVHFELIHPVKEKNGRNWLSMRDLKECVDSVLRPARIEGRVKIDKVFLDPLIDLDQPELVALLNAVGKSIGRMGFQVEILWKEGRAMPNAEKLEKIKVNEKAPYLEFKIGLGETGSLRTSAFGEETKSRGQSIGVATALHWSILKMQQKSDPSMTDRWITLSDKPSLAGLTIPACRLDLILGKGTEKLAGRQIATAVANSLIFARKAMDQQANMKAGGEK